MAGKTVLLTGAASGIGAELARQLAALDARLILIDRNKDGLSRVRQELSPAAVTPVVVDVGDAEALSRALADCGISTHEIDIVIANAGATKMTFVDELNLEDCRKLHAVNFWGAVHVIQMVLPAMLARRQGHIVTVCSLAGIRGLVEGAYYSSSKGALMHFVESLRIDVKPRGLQVTNVFPGFVDTPINEELKQYYRTPLMVSAEQMAAAILRGVAKGKREVFYPWYIRPLAYLIKIVPNRWWEKICIYDLFRLRLKRGNHG